MKVFVCFRVSIGVEKLKVLESEREGGGDVDRMPSDYREPSVTILLSRS